MNNSFDSQHPYSPNNDGDSQNFEWQEKAEAFISSATDKSLWRKMWKTRPVRIPDDQGGGYIGGICEGIGVRYQIDPLIVRIIFAAFALANFDQALGLYLVLWLILPRYTVEKSPFEVLVGPKDPRYSQDRTTAIILIVVLILFGSSSMFFEYATIPGLITLACTAVIWWFLYTRTPQPPLGFSADAQSTASQKSTATSPQNTSRTEQTTSQHAAFDTTGYSAAKGFEDNFQMPQAPKWDPLGTVPELWNLPEPPEPEPQPAAKSRKRWIRWVLIPILIIVTLVTATVNSFILGVRHTQFSNQDYVISKVEQLKPEYSNSFGNLTIDFSQLPQVPTDTTVEISNSFGNVEITLPKHSNYVLSCDTFAGEDNCYPDSLIINQDKPVLTIHVENEFGEIEVK